MAGVNSQIEFNDMVNIIISIWGNVFILVMIFSLYISKNHDKNNKNIKNISIPYTDEILIFYILIFFYNLFYAIISMIEITEVAYAKQAYLTATFLYYIVGAMLMFLFFWFCKKYVADPMNDKILDVSIKVMTTIQVILLVLLIVNIFTGIIFYYDDIEGYKHGWGYFVWQGYIAAALTFLLILLFIRFRRLNSFLKYILGIVVTLPIMAITFDLIFEYANFNNAFIIIAALLIYLQYENYRAMYSIETVLQMEDAQKKLMMDQIKPHFLHNSLNSIIYYIDKDPKKAKEALVNFSKYLRTNLDSVNTEDLIPVSEELEHTKVYLALEKLRFEEKLNIEYDIQDENFMVPTLSIQPMVENAVKHGIRKSETGSGTIKISTKETENHHIVQIVDDGTGFDVESLADMDDSHIGVKSVMKRLIIECRGTLEFDSGEGKGTSCIIKIPK